jgi:sugar phosphate isomerase/epimerase
MKIGLMLYTLREECAQDLQGTLAAVAELGYEGVELFDLHGHEADTVRGWLDDLGLVAVGRHASLQALEHELPELAEELDTLGCNRIALAWIDPPQTSADARPLAAHIAELAEAADGEGLRLGFHNHWGELAPLDDGLTFLDLLRALSAERLWLELDLGWAWVAGVDPAALLLANAGSCPLVHVKDFRSREGREYCPVGQGAVGYERVIPAAAAAGVEWLLVEQDEVEGSGLAAVEQSLAAVRRMAGVAA